MSEPLAEILLDDTDEFAPRCCQTCKHDIPEHQDGFCPGRIWDHIKIDPCRHCYTIACDSTGSPVRWEPPDA